MDKRSNSRQSSSDPTTSWDADIGPVRVHFGEHRSREAADWIERTGGRRVLVVADPGVVAAGHLDRLIGALVAAERTFEMFTGIVDNPTTTQVEAGRAFAADFAPDCMVAVGGGSAMDCAKGINFLLTNGGSMVDYWGFGKTSRSLLPAIGVPTTAGTGSEAQSYALITDDRSGRKMACGDPGARFRSVILDPELLNTVPLDVAAAAGIDALAHAVESFVTTRRNPISNLLARQAWTLLESNLVASIRDERSLRQRGEALLGAHLAGAAIEQSMLGAAHACANPLTARFDLAHGAAVGLVLPSVVRFNAGVVEPLYRQLVASAQLEPVDAPGETVALRLESMRRQLELPERLRDVGVDRTALAELAIEAAREWTGTFNPRPVDSTELEAIYRAAF